MLNKLLTAAKLKRKPRVEAFSSNRYWEQRYKAGGNSGAGSYGRLAQFKAGVLNHFVEEESIKDVIEFGFGDGNQLSLSNYPQYTGFDISHQAVELCRKRFLGDEAKKFLREFNL